MIAFVLALLAVPLLLTTVFIVEIITGIFPMQSGAAPPLAGRRVSLLMPAHDEGQILEAMLDRLAPEIDGWAKLLVVADNCTDDTAAIARSRGADVVERRDEARRGKGFALDFGRDRLRGNAPDVVIIFDADCISDRASLQLLAASALAWNLPCQATYLIRPRASSSPLVQLSNFAFMIKNLVRQRGLQRLSGRVHLVGTGMAFAWPMFDRAPLATANIVEDVELGLALDRRGTPPKLVPSAMVWSDPSSTEGTLIQRTRWERGFLAVARSTAPSSIGQAVRSFDARALVAALDLCIPPVTLLALLDGVTFLTTAILTWTLGLPWWPLAIFTISLAASVFVVTVAWAVDGRRWISAATLVKIPFYVLWKIPLYLGLARSKQTEWLRPGR